MVISYNSCRLLELAGAVFVVRCVGIISMFVDGVCVSCNFTGSDTTVESASAMTFSFQILDVCILLC